MESRTLLLSFLLLASVVGLSFSAGLEQQCATVLTKVMDCLGYSTGKEATPSPTCCTATQEIRNQNPVCLCFFIQQAYKGVPTIKQLGVQFDRLLKLPTDCKLTNTSSADCPKLLNLSPSSPDNAIFTSNSTVKSNSSSETASSSSNAYTPRTHFGDIGVLIVMIAVTLSMLSIRP